VKTLFRGGTLVGCDAHGATVKGDLLVEGTRITAVGSVPPHELRRGPIRLVDARGCAVAPGFVQAHMHLCQVLFRGMADDLPLLEWLRTRIWPLEAAHDERSLAASAELGLLEAMLAGTTTLVDMGTVHGYDAVFDACARAGVRCIGGKTMMDAGEGVPAGLRENTRESLKESDRLREAWSGKAGGRLTYAYAPRFILSCSEKLFRGTVERSRATGAFLHSHVAEHPAEREAVRRALGDDDIAILRRWGFSGDRTLLAHGVQLTDAEAKALAEDGTRIVHCPSANLKLGSGIARIAELDAFGVRLGLGPDGAPCNNNLDPWMEMRHAALLAKVRTSTTALPARRAFRLATLDGARALGMEAEIGTLEPGKLADVVVVRLDGPHVEPGGDVYSRLVYACTARDVSHVMVDGKLVVSLGTHAELDAEAVVRRARAEALKVSRRAGL
jgi:cytosine/adenosine deaminase-related metal-dependent hydrolase